MAKTSFAYLAHMVLTRLIDNFTNV